MHNVSSRIPWPKCGRFTHIHLGEGFRKKDACLYEPKSTLSYICFVSRQQHTTESEADGRSRQEILLKKKKKVEQNNFHRWFVFYLPGSLKSISAKQTIRTFQLLITNIFSLDQSEVELFSWEGALLCWISARLGFSHYIQCDSMRWSVMLLLYNNSSSAVY